MGNSGRTLKPAEQARRIVDLWQDRSRRQRTSNDLMAFYGWLSEHEPAANPDVAEAEVGEHFRLLSLEALVQIKLTAFRDKDRTHLRDMIDVGLIDRAWVERLGPELGQRLQQLLDDPEV